MEANALGTAAIGSRRTGIEDAIKHNESGILVDPFNKMEVLAAINSILERKQEFSTNAKKWAEKHSWDIIGERWKNWANEIALELKGDKKK